MWLLWSASLIIFLFGFVVFFGAPYVPSRRREVEEAFTKLYPLSKRDMLIDIGSGDGIVLRQAANRGARAVGYELNPILYLVSKFISRNQSQIKVYLADFWRVQLPAETTIVYTFGEGRDIKRMAEKVQNEANRLKKPLYFMSYGFKIPGTKPSATYRAYYLYEVNPLQTAKP